MQSCGERRRTIIMGLFDSKRAVIFDLGGTLIEFENEPWDKLERNGMKTCHRFLVEHGFDIPSANEFADLFVDYRAKKWEEIKKDNVEVLFHKLCAEFIANYSIDLGDAIHEFVKVFYSSVTEQLQLKDGSLEALEFVKGRMLKIGLVSNSPFPADWHREEMKRFGIYKYFDYTLFSSEFGMRKPDAAMFSDCLSFLGVEPREAIHIGDRPTEDIAGAQAAGIRSVLVRREDRHLPEHIKPDFTIDNLRELLSM